MWLRYFLCPTASTKVAREGVDESEVGIRAAVNQQEPQDTKVEGQGGSCCRGEDSNE